MRKRQDITFKLAHIKTLEFAVIENQAINKNTLESFIEIGFGISDNTGQIQCGIKFKLSTDDKPFIIIHVVCTFDIESASWGTIYNDKKEVHIIPKSFAKHSAVLVMGTARGVLHAKTEGTDFNKYFIPTMNIDEQIMEDIVIPAS